MKFYATLLVCALIAVSQTVAQPQMPRAVFMQPGRGLQPLGQTLSPIQIEMFFQRQIRQATSFGRRMQMEISNVCRNNYAVMNDVQKRRCSCSSVFAFLNEGGNAMLIAGIRYLKIWDAINAEGGPLKYCNNRQASASRQVNFLCHCMTGNPSV